MGVQQSESLAARLAEAVRAREAAERAREAAERTRDAAVRAGDAAVRASRAKSEFLSRMSHELRTPLNSILGFAQLLELSHLDESDTESVSLIQRAGRHLLELINDALDVSRIETGRLSLSLSPVRLTGVLTESFDLVRPGAVARGVSLEASAAVLGDASVVADRQRLKQVLVNLLANGVKYNRDGGTVTVDCAPLAHPPGGREAPYGWLRLTVSDTGVGIPVDRLSDVFVPFERLGAEATDVEGSGVGLSLSKSLVEAMGGRIGVASAAGAGSTFHVDLPAGGSLPQPTGGAATATRTVLYVEDNESNVTLMRRVFAQRENARLVVAGDGMTGLDMARSAPPDLLLLDLHLPQLDGMRVLTALRHDDDPRLRDLPIVIVTADLSPGTEQRLLQAGATAFLAKPFGVVELLGIVDAQLG